MGRPLNKKLFGDPTTLGNQFNIEAWIPGGSGSVSAWILRQHTNNTYLVTDGSDTGRCRLQEGVLTGQGQMRMTAMPFGFDIATATATMKADAFSTSLSFGGEGYAPGDTITLTGGTVSTDAVITLDSVVSKSAITIDPGTGSTPGDVLTIVNGSPIIGATTLTVVDSKAVSASVSVDGEGYVPGEIVTLAGGIFSSAATVEITNVDVFSQFIVLAGTGYAAGDIVTLDNSTGTAPTFNITNTLAVSATVADEGAGYSVVDTLTVVIGAGTSTGNAVFNIDTVGTVVAQNETNFNGAGSNGTFVGGTLYIAADTVTYTDGTVITINAVASGVVTDFTILTASSSGSAADLAVLVQSSTTSVAGSGFVPTLGIANQSVFDISLSTAGNYTVEPVNDASTTSSGSGTGVLLTVLYGALVISQNILGDLTAIPANAALTTVDSGPGSGLTINVTYKILETTLAGSGSGYTVLPNNSVLQGITDGVGINGTFTLDWGVDTVTTSAEVYSSIPFDPVSTTGGGGDATFNVDWRVGLFTITTPGDYSIVPPNFVLQGATSGSGTGATFNMGWDVLAVIVTDDGGGYVSAPAVTLSGGGGSGATATSTLTSVSGSTPPDEAVASITVIADGEGYSSTPTVTIAGPVGDVEYIRILNAHVVKTFEGNQYSWSEFLADSFSEVDLDLS